MWYAQMTYEWNLRLSYTEATLLLLSQMTFDQVQGLTWFWFQSVSWMFGTRNEVLNANRASPEREHKTVSQPLCKSGSKLSKNLKHFKQQRRRSIRSISLGTVNCLPYWTNRHFNLPKEQYLSSNLSYLLVQSSEMKVLPVGQKYQLLRTNCRLNVTFKSK